MTKSTLWSKRAGAYEILAAAGIALVAWRLFMGWDWSNVAVNGVDPGPFSDGSADTRHGVAVGAVAAVAIFWLGLRGRPILGPLAVFAPIVVFSGWRLDVARTADASFWPVGLAFLIVAGGVGCAVLAGVSSAIRLSRRPSGLCDA